MRIAVLAVGLGCLAASAARSDGGPAYRASADLDGIAVELALEPLAGSLVTDELREGHLVHFRIAISDAATGTPLSGVFPAAWMDRLPPGEVTDAGKCIDKVEMFLGGSLLSKAELDLNVYYVVTMNDNGTLSVVDPLFGFGGSRLLATPRLWASGRDWELTEDRRRIFVSMPTVDAVAVVETHNWQVVTNIPTPPSPGRIVGQPDGTYLWVGFDRPEPGQEASGVLVLEPADLAERTRLVTGRGPHEIAVSGDNRFAFVTNAGDGTVSVIDVRRLEIVDHLATGSEPSSITWSAAARAVYVAHRASGDVVAIDAETRQVTGRMKTRPGLAEIRSAPGGRLVLAVNPAANLLHVIDTAVNEIVQTGPMGGGPDQIAFSDTLAYIRHRDSVDVLMVPLDEIGRRDAPIPVVDFPGGRNPAGRGGDFSLAPAIVKAPGANAVLVANPLDGMIYYYMEGMAAPMGAFQSYGGRNGAVMVVDNSLRERAPGIYETTARLRRPGRYDLAFFLDSPRSVHCFPLVVTADPELAKLRARRELRVETVAAESRIRVTVGEPAVIRLQVTDGATGEPRAGLEDLEILAMLAPGRWHVTRPVRDLGAGEYELELTPPSAGLYYLFAQCPSQGLELGDSRPLAYLIAGGAGAAASEGER